MPVAHSGHVWWLSSPVPGAEAETCGARMGMGTSCRAVNCMRACHSSRMDVAASPAAVDGSGVAANDVRGRVPRGRLPFRIPIVLVGFPALAWRPDAGLAPALVG